MQEIVVNNAPNPLLENLNEHNNYTPVQNNPVKKPVSPPPIQKQQSNKMTNDGYIFSEPSRQPKKVVKDSMDEFDDIIKDLETKNIINNNKSGVAPKTNINSSNQQNRVKDDPFSSDFFQNNKLLNETRYINSSKKQNIPTMNTNNDVDDFVSNKKLLFKEKTKPDIASQKKKFDSFFQNTTNEKSAKDSKQYDDLFFDDEIIKPNKVKNNADNNSLFQEAEERKYSSTLKKQNTSKQNKFSQNDDLLEELFGDDLFGGSKNRARSPTMSQSNKTKNLQKSNAGQTKNIYDDIFNQNEDPFFDNRNSPWSGENKTFQTRRSRYIPGVNSGKKDNLSKPTSGKWNQVITNTANSATKTGTENQKSSYVPSFLNSGNDNSKKGTVDTHSNE
jgi:hypothetical protein